MNARIRGALALFALSRDDAHTDDELLNCSTKQQRKEYSKQKIVIRKIYD